MLLYDTDVSTCVMKLRQLAASFQAGGTLVEIKTQVDQAIRNLNASLGSERSHRLAAWSTLLLEIERYASVLSDYRWLEVMNHARIRIKSRRQTILSAYKRSGTEK